MKLPKRELPVYSTDLKASGLKNIQYRPHTVKEEQILNMASLSDSDKDKLAAVKQIVENCVDYDVSTLFPAEIEYLFMKIKACSDSPKVPVIYTIVPEIDPKTGKNKHANCGETIETTFDIDKDIVVEETGDMDKYATRAKDGSWLVDIGQSMQLQIRVKPLNAEVSESSIYELTESVIDEANDSIVYKGDDFNEEEFLEWIGSIDSSAFSKFKEFMNSTPSCVANLTFKCKCGEVYKEKEYGVLRFLV